MNVQIKSFYFNRIIQEYFIDWRLDFLANNINAFNQKLIDWLFYIILK